MAGIYTGNENFLKAGIRAAEYYHPFVASFQACGTPMDTWKAPDEEGNLAFMKLCRILHEATGEERFLKMLEDGATYEYTWRYGYRTIPELPPLRKSGWNSCGGSVTSVSNPHIHPMGVLATEELFYLARMIGCGMHEKRAVDGIAFAMNILELYPAVTGYGRYGVTTERYCPSDGLTIETYNDGRNASMWFSYNAWAAGNILEALLWVMDNKVLEQKK